jgi:hypothetical protein
MIASNSTYVSLPIRSILVIRIALLLSLFIRDRLDGFELVIVNFKFILPLACKVFVYF